MQSDIVQLVIIILILGIATIFTLAEYSLVKVRPTELQTMEQTKNVVAAQKLVEKLTEYLSTAQVGITLTSLILGG
ncbi:CNNM domain-containing protein [Ligilactobacillus equi]|uniref:CNNM domain-containing protein n=1 Tax=Ligilactobacillus equi TaxID=137357 RepID=UPI000AA77B4C